MSVEENFSTFLKKGARSAPKILPSLCKVLLFWLQKHFGARSAPENFLTLKKVESYYITIAQAEILRGGHKLGSEGGVIKKF